MKAKRLAKKFVYALVTVLCVLVFNYVLFRLLPGSFLTNIAHTSHGNAEQLARLEEFYGLDGSWYEQFFAYVKNLARLDLGISYKYSEPVWSVIRSRILPTVLLLGVSEVIAIAVGMVIGVVAAWRHGTAADTGLLTASLLFYSMPTFWLGMLLILVFCSGLGWLPSVGMQTQGLIQEFVSTWSYIADVARHMVLPVACMSLGMVGEYCITMRSSMISILSEDYITTARAKGFREKYVLMRHALPNAMLPMVTLITMNLGYIIAGAVQIETLFTWPGLGSLMYIAITNRDYTLLQGLFLLVTVSIVLANFLADLLYELIDPRVNS